MRDSDLVRGADQPRLDGGLTTPALKSLVVDGLRLVPQFSATVSSYAATVETDVERLTLVATTADSRSSMSISHADADPDTDGHQVDFAVGVNVITFSIVAEDGVNAKTYKLVVTRARPDPDDASLSQLRISDVVGRDEAGHFRQSRVELPCGTNRGRLQHLIGAAQLAMLALELVVVAPVPRSSVRSCARSSGRSR